MFIRLLYVHCDMHARSTFSLVGHKCSSLHLSIHFTLSFQNDPLSEKDPCNAIACRRDLEPQSGSRYPAGGLDGKVVILLTHAHTYITCMTYLHLDQSCEDESRIHLLHSFIHSLTFSGLKCQVYTTCTES